MARHLIVPIALMGLLACNDTQDPASPPPRAIAAQLVQNEWIDFSFVIPNYCTGENMNFVGSRKHLTTYTEDGGGGYHFNFHRNWTGTATGVTTGNVYTINFPINWTENVKPPYPYSAQRVWYNNVTCRGNCPTQLFRSWLHLTINAGGEITSERDEASIVCPGSK